MNKQKIININRRLVHVLYDPEVSHILITKHHLKEGIKEGCLKCKRFIKELKEK